ncbi:MAG TPA: threonine ammonia-lyase [Candidatus Acidoferrales bacterium]|jgi:threonine dehydratase|nr:threonine ammonia-lyase [Candidatus Acidoferrales bacterium]
MNLTLENIREAAERLRSQVMMTPCTNGRTLSQIVGAEIFLKSENQQFTASFKERGALNKLLSLSPPEKRLGVIAMSAGNHAQGVAYHARRLNIPAVIVMPKHTPQVKVEHTRGHGAKVILHGDTFDEASRFTLALAKERKLILIHPYDDLLVMAGQGTIALEMLAQQPDLDTLFVPIGGGGLIAGMAVAAKGIKPDIKIIGVQSARFPAMAGLLKGQPVKCERFTVAEGIAVKSPGRLTRKIVRKLVDDILLVDEGEIENAVLMLLQIEKTMVEGAGACGLAGLLKYRRRFQGKKIGLVLCGGNMDLMILSAIIQRGLVRSGQLIRLRVDTRDVPGELGRLTGLIGAAEGNIMEVHHQRAFSTEPLQTAVVDVILQARGLDHLANIVGLLNKNCFRTSLPDNNLLHSKNYDK